MPARRLTGDHIANDSTIMTKAIYTIPQTHYTP
jgi:hypothetical protein